MFDLGIQELIVIFIVALLVFGPDKLPELAKNMAKGLADLKRAMSGVKDQIDSEVNEVKNMKEFKDLKDPLALKEHLYKDDTLIKVPETEKAEDRASEAAYADAEGTPPAEPAKPASDKIEKPAGETTNKG